MIVKYNVDIFEFQEWNFYRVCFIFFFSFELMNCGNNYTLHKIKRHKSVIQKEKTKKK